MLLQSLQSRWSLRGVLLTGLVLLMLPGFFARNTEWAGMTFAMFLIAVPLAVLWLLNRGLDDLFRNRR